MVNSLQLFGRPRLEDAQYRLSLTGPFRSGWERVEDDQHLRRPNLRYGIPTAGSF